MKWRAIEFKPQDLFHWHGEAFTVVKSQVDYPTNRIFITAQGERPRTFIFPATYGLEGTLY